LYQKRVFGGLKKEVVQRWSPEGIVKALTMKGE
jgi:hypothetical protein